MSQRLRFNIAAISYIEDDKGRLFSEIKIFIVAGMNWPFTTSHQLIILARDTRIK